MGSAISTVTHLKIDTTAVSSSHMEGVAEILSLLACACPSLTKLEVSGSFSRAMLAAFGGWCSKLSCLVMTDLTDRSNEVLHQLHLILPELTHCSLPSLPVTSQKTDSYAQPCCKSLLSCASLTHLDLGTRTLTPHMWSSLPLGLRRLKCALDDEAPAAVHTPNNLQHLDVCCDEYDCVDLRSILAALWVVPQLKTLTLCGTGEPSKGRLVPRIYVPCMIDDDPDRTHIQALVYLHELVVAGLHVASSLNGEEILEGVTLSMGDGSDCDEDEGVGDFLACLPPFPAFHGLVLDDTEDLDSEGISLQGIAAIFPNLTSFTMTTGAIHIEDLEQLGALKALQHLALSTEAALPAPGYMDALCSRLPCLKMLCLHQGAPVLCTDAELFQNILRRIDPTHQPWELVLT